MLHIDVNNNDFQMTSAFKIQGKWWLNSAVQCYAKKLQLVKKRE